MKGWTEFTIIYQGFELLPYLDVILNTPNLVMTVVQLPDGDDFR